MTRIRTALALPALALAVAGCAMAETPAETAPALAASAQPAGTSVTVDMAAMPADGWVVIHATRDGKPVVPSSIGHARIKAGANENVVVELSEPTAPGDVVVAMLHHDTGEAGVYEFGPGSVKTDKPVIVEGKPVVRPIKIK